MNQFNAQSGLNSIDITGAGNTGPTDGIQQSVATTAGHQYALSFYVGRAQTVAGNGTGLVFYNSPATVDLSINGGALELYEFKFAVHAWHDPMDAILDELHCHEWKPRRLRS